MIEEIKHKDTLLAIILSAEYEEEGISFFTCVAANNMPGTA